MALFLITVQFEGTLIALSSVQRRLCSAAHCTASAQAVTSHAASRLQSIRQKRVVIAAETRSPQPPVGQSASGSVRQWVGLCSGHHSETSAHSHPEHRGLNAVLLYLVCPQRRPVVRMFSKMGEKKTSARSQEASQRRILDRATRQRRLNRQLEALEKDNFQDDPHASLPQLAKRLPQFDDSNESGKKRKKTRGDHFKLRFRKNFQALLEEQNLSVSDGPNYVTACAPPSKLPQRHFCAVCGFPSSYTCVSCGARYCCVRCLGTHHETRCLKWTL